MGGQEAGDSREEEKEKKFGKSARVPWQMEGREAGDSRKEEKEKKPNITRIYKPMAPTYTYQVPGTKRT